MVSLLLFFSKQRPQRPQTAAECTYPINGYPGHIIVRWAQGIGRQGILMHQLVSKISIHTAHDGVPVQLRAVNFHALQAKKGGKHTSLSAVK